MKKSLLFLFAVVFISLFVIAGCSSEGASNTNDTDQENNSGENNSPDDTSNDSGNESVDKKYDKPEVVFRFADVPSEHDEMIEAERVFADYIFEETNGRVKVELYPGAQLGNNKEVIQAVKMGAIDIARMQLPMINDSGVNDSKLKVLSLPYVFKNKEHAWRVLRGPIGDEIIDIVDNSDANIVGLGFFEVTARNFFTTNKPVATIEDMKGLKIRVQSNPLYLDMVEAFGASPTPISFSELYSALQTGVVHGAENPIKGYYNDKFYEVAKYYTLNPNDSAEPSLMFISKMSWNKLTDEEKEIFKEAANEAGIFLEEKLNENLPTYMKELEDAGVEFVELQDYEKWKEAVQPLYEEYGAGNEDLIKRIQETE